MGHSNVFDYYHFNQGESIRKYVTGGGSEAIPVLANGNLPKFVLVQACIASGVNEAIAAKAGNYITIAPVPIAGNGNENFDMPLIVGDPPMVLLVHGFSFVAFAFPGFQIGHTNTVGVPPEGIDLRMTPLNNV
jgi:hypothetical protein